MDASNGSLWVAVRLPSSFQSFVFGVPATVRHLIGARDFVARSEDGLSSGTIRVSKEGACWGFNRFLSRYGADSDDILVTEFNLVNGVATLRLGGDDLLEEYNPVD
jgi:hypothetical protein